MSEQRPSFGEFWDTVVDDPLLAAMPDHTTFSPLTVSLAKTQLDPTVPPADPADAEATRAAVAALPQFAAGKQGDLELLGTVLGEGGMGVVLLAQQRSLNREVAVKTLHPDSTDPTLIEALLQEACLAGALSHPNVVPIHTLGRDEARRPLLVMKRVEGHTWGDLLADPNHPAWSSGRWSDDPLARNLEILLELCNAVHFAHDRGILHRDLKPNNIMVGAFGEVYLMDWGIAAPAGSATYPPGGSPPYMAPEMLSGEATEQTDVYLLGSILHEILTGRRRHRGASRMGILLSVSRSEPVEFDPAIPAELASACNRATHVEPAQRFESVLAFRRAITDYEAHRGSLQLAQAAGAVLADVREQLQAAEPDPVVVARRFAECRFGFQQSLQGWPENPSARAGLRACLDALITWELDRGGAAAASALLAERVALDPEPAGELAALAKRIGTLRQDSERMRRLVTDLDASVSQRERARFFLGIVAVALLVMATLFFLIRSEVVTPNSAILIALPILGLTLVSTALLLGRRTLLANVFNRRIMYTLLLLILGIFFHRVVGANVGLSFEQILTTDMVLVSVVACGAGIGISRWMFSLAGVTAIGAIVASVVPAHALAILLGTMALTISLGAVLLIRLGPDGAEVE